MIKIQKPFGLEINSGNDGISTPGLILNGLNIKLRL